MPPNSNLQQRVEAPSDEHIVARVRAGDEAVFEAIFRQHHDGLWRFAYHQVGDAETAREIVQDVFFALWRKHAEWEVTSSIAGWLYGAVRHHILRHRRTERSVARITDLAARAAIVEHGQAVGDVIAVAMGAVAHDAQTLVEDGELDAAVSRALATLPERRRLAMTLRWKHDLPAPEIARVLGTTPQAVRHLLMRAREEIAAILNRTDR
jgi:RNA polymerase sigma-70 factor (ECF subfamily)